MPTTQEEKPAKARNRNRKADQRSRKAEPKTQVAPEQMNRDQVNRDAELAGPEILPTEAEPMAAEALASEAVTSEPVASETLVSEILASEALASEGVAPEAITPEAAPSDVAAIAAALEKAVEAPLSGEILPPVRKPAGSSAGLLAIVQAHDDYTRKSWANGRSLVERLIAARSFDVAIEAQSEFAKQAYANFLVHSQRICGLYGEWAQQFFRPFDKFAAGWPRR
jgi:hypothetical protein